jgi:hypothetical protein
MGGKTNCEAAELYAPPPSPKPAPDNTVLEDILELFNAAGA